MYTYTILTFFVVTMKNGTSKSVLVKNQKCSVLFWSELVVSSLLVRLTGARGFLLPCLWLHGLNTFTAEQWQSRWKKVRSIFWTGLWFLRNLTQRRDCLEIQISTTIHSLIWHVRNVRIMTPRAILCWTIGAFRSSCFICIFEKITFCAFTVLGSLDFS